MSSTSCNIFHYTVEQIFYATFQVQGILLLENSISQVKIALIFLFLELPGFCIDCQFPTLSRFVPQYKSPCHNHLLISSYFLFIIFQIIHPMLLVLSSMCLFPHLYQVYALIVNLKLYTGNGHVCSLGSKIACL